MVALWASPVFQFVLFIPIYTFFPFFSLKILSEGRAFSVGTVEQLFWEAKVNPNGTVKYKDFVKILTAPVPDYY